jgi:DNA-binding winged helix-turn-helix (wHTH) protein
MKKVENAGPPKSLTLELSSGTVVIGDRRVELSLREFRLLAALANHVGEAVPPEDLIQAAWPDEPWTAKENLYNLVNKLRRSIHGPDRFGRNIRNRRGFGYMLDLEAGDVRVIDSVDVSTDNHVILLEPVEVDDQSQVPEVIDLNHNAPTEVAKTALRRGPSFLRMASIGALSFLILSSMWVAGYRLAQRRDAPQTEAITAPQTETSEKVNDSRTPDRKGRSRPDDKKQPRRDRRPGKHTAPPVGGSGPAPVIAGTGSLSGSTQTADPSADSKIKARPEPEPPAPVAAAPTRFLYHLVNPETGDHFVTVDGATASEYEGRGYQGGAIGGLYTAPPQEIETRSIATNRGTGYIFASSSPPTEPASRTLPLYYSSNAAGDFFYSTSSSEANRSGWSGSLVGYVKAL